MLGQIKSVKQRDNETIKRLLNIWESSVKATHTFLTPEDIASIYPEVKQGLAEISQLYIFCDNKLEIQAFLGVEDNKIEMLFIDNDVRGQGIGKQLINYAVDNLNIQYVDVNEQNTQGVGFYIHMGFEIINRSELDSQQREFPILHLKKKS